MKWMVLVVLVSVMLGCSTAPQQSMVDVESREETLDLAGDWAVALDPGDIGLSQKWYERQLDSDGMVRLLGSLTA